MRLNKLMYPKQGKYLIYDLLHSFFVKSLTYFS